MASAVAAFTTSSDIRPVFPSPSQVPTKSFTPRAPSATSFRTIAAASAAVFGWASRAASSSPSAFLT